MAFLGVGGGCGALRAAACLVAHAAGAGGFYVVNTAHISCCLTSLRPTPLPRSVARSSGCRLRRALRRSRRPPRRPRPKQHEARCQPHSHGCGVDRARVPPSRPHAGGRPQGEQLVIYAPAGGSPWAFRDKTHKRHVERASVSRSASQLLRSSGGRLMQGSCRCRCWLLAAAAAAAAPDAEAVRC